MTKMSMIGEWIKKMEYYSALKKQWNSIICDNMDEVGRYYDKWNKSVTEGWMIPILRGFLNSQMYRSRQLSVGY